MCTSSHCWSFVLTNTWLEKGLSLEFLAKTCHPWCCCHHQLHFPHFQNMSLGDALWHACLLEELHQPPSLWLKSAMSVLLSQASSHLFQSDCHFEHAVTTSDMWRLTRPHLHKLPKEVWKSLLDFCLFSHWQWYENVAHITSALWARSHWLTWTSPNARQQTIAEYIMADVSHVWHFTSCRSSLRHRYVCAKETFIRSPTSAWQTMFVFKWMILVRVAPVSVILEPCEQCWTSALLCTKSQTAKLICTCQHEIHFRDQAALFGRVLMLRAVSQRKFGELPMWHSWFSKHQLFGLLKKSILVCLISQECQKYLIQADSLQSSWSEASPFLDLAVSCQNSSCPPGFFVGRSVDPLCTFSFLWQSFLEKEPSFVWELAVHCQTTTMRESCTNAEWVLAAHRKAVSVRTDGNSHDQLLWM